MKGKWAKGIAPRFFSWIIKDKLAVSERPGGYARNHRRVRRQEEILWLRGEGFTRVVSLLTSPHNLHAYDELDMAWAHIPFGPHDDPHLVLPDLYAQLREWMASGERLLVHHEELSDRLMGVVSGYLRWSGLVPAGPQAISVVERIMHRQMGPDGRELVAMAPQLAGAGGCVGAITTRARTSEQVLARAKESAASAAAAAMAALVAERVAPVARVVEVVANGAHAPATQAPVAEAPVAEAAIAEALLTEVLLAEVLLAHDDAPPALDDAPPGDAPPADHAAVAGTRVECEVEVEEAAPTDFDDVVFDLLAVPDDLLAVPDDLLAVPDVVPEAPADAATNGTGDHEPG